MYDNRSGWLGLGLVAAVGLVGCGRSSAPAEGLVDPGALKIDGQASVAPVEARGPGSSAGTFTFPDDRGGRLAADLLTPSEKARTPVADLSSPARKFPVSPEVDQPALPLAANQAPPAQLPRGPAAPPSLPAGVAEETPLLGYADNPAVPVPPRLPADAPVRLASPSPEEPAALPYLAQAVPDRAPLDDPTSDFSRDAALAAVPPARATPVPFQPEKLPDPFEFRQPLVPPPDEEVVVTAAPRPPGM